MNTAPLSIELVGGPACGKRIAGIDHDAEGTVHTHLGQDYFYIRTEEPTRDRTHTRFLFTGRSRPAKPAAT